MRFVTDASYVLNDKNKTTSTVQFRTSLSVGKMCKVLVEGYAKYFNVHIVVHKSIMADTNLKDQAKAVHP